GNMVIDIGGGTTEIAVIALSGIVSDTSIRTGGDELDQAIVQFMRKNYNLLIGEPTAEQIKIQIGSAAPVGEEREMEVKGRDLVSGIPKIVRVHSSEIREAVQEPIQQIVDAVRRALEITPPELASDLVDRGIVMTGGGAPIRSHAACGRPCSLRSWRCSSRPSSSPRRSSATTRSSRSATPPPSPPPSSPSCGAKTRGSAACSAWAHGSRAATRRPKCYASLS